MRKKNSHPRKKGNIYNSSLKIKKFVIATINVETAAATVNRHSRDDPQYLQAQTESLRKCSNKEMFEQKLIKHNTGTVAPY